MVTQHEEANEREIQEFLNTIPQPVSYDTVQEQLKAEQAGMSREDIAKAMASKSEATFDPETAVPDPHNWIDRGLVMSCEGANHATHRHFKVKRK